MADLTSLDKLHDVIIALPPPLWPPAPGWWVAEFLTTTAIIWLAGSWYIRWKKNAYRRDALLELSHIEASVKRGEYSSEILFKLPELLKRTALSAYGREEVASLTGMPWLKFLEKKCPETQFSDKSGQLIIRFSYEQPRSLSSVPENDISILLMLVRKWINGHETVKSG